HAADVVGRARGGEQQVAIGAPVLFRRLDVDRVEPLLDRPASLVRSQDALPRRDERSGDFLQVLSHRSSSCLTRGLSRSKGYVSILFGRRWIFGRLGIVRS